MINLKNKRGFSFLSETVLKLIIASICLVILFGLLGKLYFSNVENKEFNQAKETMRKLKQEINSIKPNQVREFNIYSPMNNWDDQINKWTFLSFDSSLPKECRKKCICICKGNGVDDCNKLGICIETDFSLKDKIELNNPPVILNIDSKSNLISLKIS